MLELVQHRATRIVSVSQRSAMKRGWEYWTCLLLSIEETEVTQLRSTNICTESTRWMLQKFYLAIRLRGWRGEAKHCSWLKEVAMDRLGKCFLKQRIIAWNSMPQDVVTAGMVNCFKGRFDRWKQSAISGAIWAEQPTGSLMMMMNSWLIWGIQCKLGKMTVYCQSDDTKLDRIQYPCTIRSRLCIDSIRR